MSLAEELLADLEEGDDGDEMLEAAYGEMSKNKGDGGDDPMEGGLVDMDVDDTAGMKGELALKLS